MAYELNVGDLKRLGFTGGTLRFNGASKTRGYIKNNTLGGYSLNN